MLYNDMLYDRKCYTMLYYTTGNVIQHVIRLKMLPNDILYNRKFYATKYHTIRNMIQWHVIK